MNNQSMQQVAAILGIAMLTIIVGCSKGPELFEVRGKVTLDGEPLSSGNVMFTPANGGREIANGKVENGQYTLQCIAGEKVVQIVGYTSSSKVVPPDYVMAGSGLSAKVEENTEVDFDLSTKRRRRR